MHYLSKYFTSKAIAVYFVVLVSCLVLFSANTLPVIWIGFGITEIVFFFYFSSRLSLKWARYHSVIFSKKLFNTALIIRVVYVIFIYFFYIWTNKIPFEFDAGDSVWYHNEGLIIIDMIQHGRFGKYYGDYKTGLSDSGFPLWLAAIYSLSFKSIIIARLVNALLSAWMCVLIYKLAQRNFGEEAARISAIFAMLLPTLIYYCGLHFKETGMAFLLIAFAERSDYLLRTHTIKFGIVLSIVTLGIALFFFRTVLAVAACFALLSTLLFSAKRLIGSYRKTALLSWFAIAAVFVFSGPILIEVEATVKNRTIHQKSQMEFFSSREGANKFSKYGTTAVFAPLMLVAPLPTMVYIELQKNAMMIHGNIFIHNVYAFFVILALMMLYKRKLLTSHVLILTLLLSYLSILALSGFALSERFHMPIVPFLLILAGYGVTQVNKQNIKFYVPYLVFIMILIIGWNWFKLAGRVLI